MGDGKAALKAAIEFLKQIPKTPEGRSPIVFAIEDGDLVVIHMDISFMGKRKAIVDIFRVRDGLVVEHWDAIQDIDDSWPYAGMITISGREFTDMNKALVRRMYEIGKTYVDADRSIDRVHRILGEGNFVVVQADGRKRDTPFVFYDLYRIENGVIADRWNIEQQIPATAKNSNGMI
jgi:predicted SnoaL-like aldol condensation-catalyzing enzyme